MSLFALKTTDENVFLDVVHQIHKIRSRTQHRLAVRTLAPWLTIDQFLEACERLKELVERRNGANRRRGVIPCDLVEPKPVARRLVPYVACHVVIGPCFGFRQAGLFRNGLLRKIRCPRQGNRGCRVKAGLHDFAGWNHIVGDGINPLVCLQFLQYGTTCLFR